MTAASYTISQVAELLNCAPHQVKRLVKQLRVGNPITPSMTLLNAADVAAIKAKLKSELSETKPAE